MADERKFALPDSMQFRAFYAQKRRRSRNSIVAPITRTFIDLDPIANAYYEMAAPITFAGDFEIEFDVYASALSDNAVFGAIDGSGSFIRLVDASNFRLQLDGSHLSTISLSTPIPLDKLSSLKVILSGNDATVFVDGVLSGSHTFSSGWTFTVSLIGQKGGVNYFNGIIANAKFTDKSGASDVVTTFRLDNSPAAENYTYSTELLDNNTFPDNANARQYLVSSKGWIITDGGAA